MIKREKKYFEKRNLLKMKSKRYFTKKLIREAAVEVNSRPCEGCIA